MFRVDLEVRDNEIDIQGIVNNANYFIYMAHARHLYLHSINIDFAAMALDNQNLLLISSNIEFKRSLRPNDKFYVTCEMVAEGKIRVAFEQEVRRTEGDELVVKARNIAVCMDGNRNRPYVPEKIKQVLATKIKEQ